MTTLFAYIYILGGILAYIFPIIYMFLSDDSASNESRESRELTGFVLAIAWIFVLGPAMFFSWPITLPIMIYDLNKKIKSQSRGRNFEPTPPTHGRLNLPPSNKKLEETVPNAPQEKSRNYHKTSGPQAKLYKKEPVSQNSEIRLTNTQRPKLEAGFETRLTLPVHAPVSAHNSPKSARKSNLKWEVCGEFLCRNLVRIPLAKLTLDQSLISGVHVDDESQPDLIWINSLDLAIKLADLVSLVDEASRRSRVGIIYRKPAVPAGKKDEYQKPEDFKPVGNSVNSTNVTVPTSAARKSSNDKTQPASTSLKSIGKWKISGKALVRSNVSIPFSSLETIDGSIRGFVVKDAEHREIVWINALEIDHDFHQLLELI